MISHFLFCVHDFASTQDGHLSTCSRHLFQSTSHAHSVTLQLIIVQKQQQQKQKKGVIGWCAIDTFSFVVVVLLFSTFCPKPILSFGPKAFNTLSNTDLPHPPLRRRRTCGHSYAVKLPILLYTFLFADPTIDLLVRPQQALQYSSRPCTSVLA